MNERYDRLAELFTEISEIYRAMATEIPSSLFEQKDHLLEPINEPLDEPIKKAESGDKAFLALSREELESHPVVAYLEECGIRCVLEMDPIVSESGLVKVARFLAKKYVSVKPLLDKMKANQGNRYPIEMFLKTYPTQQTADITHFAHLAREIEVIPSMEYRNAPDFRLRLTPPTYPHAINFVTGEWLEFYAHAEAIRLMNERGSLSDTPNERPLRRLKLRLPNETDFELDLCGMGREGFWWVEAKATTDFEGYLQKYQTIAKTLGSKRETSILLCAEFDRTTRHTETIRASASNAGMTPASIAEFPRMLESLLNVPPEWKPTLVSAKAGD